MKLTGGRPHRREQGFLLPLALVFLFVLLFLEIGLYELQQRAALNALDEESRLAHLVGAEELYTHLGQALETGKDSGPISLGQPIKYRVPKSDLTLSGSWSDDASANRALPSGWATYENLLKRTPGLPELSFFETDADKSGLAPGHTRLELTSSSYLERTSIVEYSHLFPYGVYAPEGAISASSITSFTNPVEFGQDKVSLESGRPVDLYAGTGIRVSDSYGSGLAQTHRGAVELPTAKGQGAIPRSGKPPGPNTWLKLVEQLKSDGDAIGSGALDKTQFLDDQFFSAAHLRALFSGDAEVLTSLFSVGQACKVPFFPIPGLQEDLPFLIVFYVWHPYPVDFSGVARDGDESKRLAEIAKEVSKLKDELDQLKKELEEEENKDKPDDSKIDRLKGKISDLQERIDRLNEEAKEIAKKKDDDKSDIGKSLAGQKVPQTAAEDAEQVTKGWSYLFVFDILGRIVKDLISGKDPFEALFTPSRVVHFGDNNPDWKWDSDTINMKANLTVPRGRTLRIEKSNVVVRGDVYLQEGAVLAIEGNLRVERPVTWSDFKGVEASDYGGFPMGRVLVDEGASLIVSGDLEVMGGDYNNGSVMLTSEYAPTKGLASLIKAGGDITIRHGMAPAVTLGDLVDELAKDNSTLRGFNDDFFRPLSEQVFTVLGRLPYAGPWQSRKSWFAAYATTFEFIPLLEEFLLGGPWPIPLPFPNCLVKVFNYFSIVYSVELNAFTGENFYTHSPYWPLGRGVAPLFLKVNPELVNEALSGLKWGEITLKAVEEEALKFLEDDLPKFAANVVQEIIVQIVESVVSNMIPFKPPSCGSEENEVTKEVEEAVKELLKDVLKEFAGILKRSFQKILLTMKQEVYDEIDSQEAKYSIYRQLPGVVVLAGGELSIGVDTESRLALGLLIGQKSVTIESNKTVGVVISLEGDVSVQELLHYPYFDRVSLYSPKKHVDIWKSLIEFEDPKGLYQGDVGQVFPKRLVEGWK